MVRLVVRLVVLASVLAGGLGATGCFVPGRGRAPQPPEVPDRLFVLPDDVETAAPARSPVLALIGAATRSIALEMYLLTDGEVVDALCAARAAGLEVTAILEPSPYRAEGANGEAYARLSAAGVDVVWANPRFPLTHAKLLIVDQRRVAVMTANLTRAGLTTNREYLLVSSDPVDVADAQAVVAADRTGALAPPPAGRLVVSPGGARDRLTALLDQADHRLEVQMEELSDGGLVAALGGAAARGLAVTVVAPARDRSPATNGALGRLVRAGVNVRLVDAPAVHAKAIVADGERFYVGSMNLTASSLGANREVGLITGSSADAAGARRISSTIAADAARGATLPEP